MTAFRGMMVSPPARRLSWVDYEAVGFVKPSGSPLNIFSRRDLLTLG
jgi:hypothetical protein